MRRLHRWLGLFTAVFLFISGLTGAVISFDHELDALLNPTFYEAATVGGEPVPPTELAARLEANDPRLRVTWLPVVHEPGHALQVFVTPRIDPATGEPFVLAFNQLAVDPVTGAIQASREWGAVSLSRENVLSFLYELHYSLHIPDGFGVEAGVLFMGIVAIVWTLDCFVSLWISFPNVKLWRRSFQFSWREGGRRLLFDLHRSGGVWIWGLLLVLAVTAVSMNLGHQVVRPLVALVSDLTPDPFAARTPNPPTRPIEPTVGREAILAAATAEGARRGWEAPPGALFYSPEYGLYGVGFYHPGDDHGDGGLGNPWLYYEARDGAPAGASVPGEGSAGDLFLQAQFPLHSGRLFGFGGRVFVSLLGLAVAALSATGVALWARKLRVRARTAAVAPASASLPAPTVPPCSSTR